MVTEREENGWTPAFSEAAERLMSRYVDQRGALLPLLHAWREEIGQIDARAVGMIAEALNLSRAEVHGVVTFYHDFHKHAASRHIVRLCRAESCQARGGAAVEQQMIQRLGVAMNKTRDDGQVRLEAVYCLGLCACGPNALVDGRPVARIDSARLESIAAQVAA